jgi:hypothetical protein
MARTTTAVHYPFTNANIISAFYGSTEKMKDVTHLLKSCNLQASLSPDQDIKKWLGDPLPNQLKSLFITFKNDKHLTFHECNNRWENPIYLAPDLHVLLTMWCGLANQLYQICSAVMITQHTRRNLLFPFRVIARTTADDDIIKQEVIPDCDQPFGFLFDESIFSNFLQNNVNSTRTLTSIPSDLKEEDVDIKYHIDRDGTNYTIDSETCAERFYSTHKTIQLAYPYRAVWPSTQEDYKLIMDTLHHIVPCPLLQKIVLGFKEEIMKKKVETKSSSWMVAHCRMESDWVKHAPQLLLSIRNFIEEVNRYIIHHQLDSVLVYVMSGCTSDETFWKVFRQYESKLIHWCRKEDFVTCGLEIKKGEFERIAIEKKGELERYVLEKKGELALEKKGELERIALEKKGRFERMAVVDRALALAADHFLGFSSSTLSLLIALERTHQHHAYDLYHSTNEENPSRLPSFYFGYDGKPLFTNKELDLGRTLKTKPSKTDEEYIIYCPKTSQPYESQLVTNLQLTIQYICLFSDQSKQCNIQTKKWRPDQFKDTRITWILIVNEHNLKEELKEWEMIQGQFIVVDCCTTWNISKTNLVQRAITTWNSHHIVNEFKWITMEDRTKSAIILMRTFLMRDSTLVPVPSVSTETTHGKFLDVGFESDVKTDKADRKEIVEKPKEDGKTRLEKPKEGLPTQRATVEKPVDDLRWERDVSMFSTSSSSSSSSSLSSYVADKSDFFNCPTFKSSQLLGIRSVLQCGWCDFDDTRYYILPNIIETGTKLWCFDMEFDEKHKEITEMCQRREIEFLYLVTNDVMVTTTSKFDLIWLSKPTLTKEELRDYKSMAKRVLIIDRRIAQFDPELETEVDDNWKVHPSPDYVIFQRIK